ncbi:hypothetical protein OVA14_03115 [Agrococcus sp. SL85]|uniref:hypothetical protein n=1 Tax=Agrococcus sp. SL85 TaxID=2995141 RepID=UPI00226CE7D9|nr:hypothetical protein [Agrococcus sp. SL85]WAC66778.1 hypothetical protein OVA14_03115 [Agrococcus sp. SL85]
MPDRRARTEHPRDPQSFTRGDRRAITIVVSIGLAITVGLLGLFVAVIVLPAL